MEKSEKKSKKQRRADRGISAELLETLMKTGQTPEGLFGPGGVLAELKGALMERMLEGELTSHLGYERHQVAEVENSRNGYSPKTVQTESGPVTIEVPRDRAGTFEPKLIPKHRRRLEGFDDKVLALYARGLSTRDIQRHLKELYETDVSPDLISKVTDGVLEELRAWQSRPIEAVYPVLYLDALFVSVRDGGQVRKKAIYLALGVGLDGRREVLGLWAEENEGARFWLSVLTDLRNRGLEDVFFVCCDGLTGFPQAIETAFPKAIVQTCIVHMIRAALRYVSYTDRREVVKSIKAIYGADTEQAALAGLEAFDATWGARYPAAVKLWRSRWTEVVPFLAFPRDVRTILYTTNAIESVNAQLRKVLRAKGHFPNDEAVFKLLYLALQNAQVHWKAPITWARAMSHFAVMFGDRFPV
jgi:putative transposase